MPGLLGVDLDDGWRATEIGHHLEGALSRVCRDNSLLTSKLEERNEEMRRVVAHKAAIARERDELLALLDVTERMKYEQGKSMIAEEEYGSFTSTELAVLGACKCRGANPEPCGCAHAAANLRKEVVKLREEIVQINKRRQEAYLTVDAYKLAFEEQMAKGRQMSQQLATVSTMTTRSVKAKAAMKFLLKSLSSDDEELFKSKVQSAEGTNNVSPDKSSMSLQELVVALTDVVHEKEESLAQQKLAAQVLANKLNELENRLPQCLLDPSCGLNSEKERECPSRSNSVEDGSTGTSRDKSCISTTLPVKDENNDNDDDFRNQGKENESQSKQKRENSDEEHSCIVKAVAFDLKDESCDGNNSADVVGGCDEERGSRGNKGHVVQTSCCDEVIQENGTGDKLCHDHNRNERESTIATTTTTATTTTVESRNS